MRVTYLRLGGPSGGSSEGVEGVWDRSHRIPDFILNLEYLREGALSLHALPCDSAWSHEFGPSATDTTSTRDRNRNSCNAPAGETEHLWSLPVSVYEADARLEHVSH